METEMNAVLPILNVEVEKNNCLKSRVYRRPTYAEFHTNFHLNFHSDYSHSMKDGVINKKDYKISRLCLLNSFHLRMIVD